MGRARRWLEEDDERSSGETSLDKPDSVPWDGGAWSLFLPRERAIVSS